MATITKKKITDVSEDVKKRESSYAAGGKANCGVSDSIVLGFPSQVKDQKPLFILFLTMYLVTVTGNLLIILAIRSDPQFQIPLYFSLSSLSFTYTCFPSVNKMLVNCLSEKNVSYAECLTQMYFMYALGNTGSCLLAVMAFDHYMAICDPFHYVTTISRHHCVLLLFLCSFPHLCTHPHMLLLKLLNFCDYNVIHHFLCDINPLLKLSCSSTFVNDITIEAKGLVVWVIPFLCIAFSHVRILIAFLTIPSAAGTCKAFFTCGSHFTVVILFYGSIFYVYLQPLSSYTVRGQLATIVDTVLSSMLNHFIYSLRNKDMNRGLGKVMSRRKS
ncbi:olfactory receptor 1L8-like [Equus asinus]|uniref:olfactory receptor 1L8-like n=1 Tax=Equus asinus TaxID=9793 RepID=UPI0038F7BE7C